MTFVSQTLRYCRCRMSCTLGIDDPHGRAMTSHEIAKGLKPIGITGESPCLIAIKPAPSKHVKTMTHRMDGELAGEFSPTTLAYIKAELPDYYEEIMKHRPANKQTGLAFDADWDDGSSCCPADLPKQLPAVTQTAATATEKARGETAAEFLKRTQFKGAA